MVTAATSPTTTGQRTVAAVFDNDDQAIRAINGLKAAGFDAQHVSVVAKDKGQMQNVTDNTEVTADGAAAGAVTGTVFGGVAGFLVGISALVIPGIGPIVGAGIIGSTLAGAGIGAATGGLVGALASQGIPEEDARGYETHVSQGRILVTVGALTTEQAQQAERTLHGAGGKDVKGYGATA